MTTPSHKRALSRSPSPDLASSASVPLSKAARTSPPTESDIAARPLLCTLPPTCNPPNKPTSLADSAALEAHYATYHAHVCEEQGCRCVFPEARLLELHQTECHDPIAAVRKERGEKIFACHLSTCLRLFSTPKTRRMHLIQAHGYPKEFFFAVTNKGVGGLLRKWGEGASLVRGQWRPRGEDKDDMDVDDDDDCDGAEEELDAEGEGDTPSVPRPIEAIHSNDTHETNNDTISKAAQQMVASVSGNTIPVPAQIEKVVSGSTSSGWLSGTPLVEDSSPSSSEPPTPERNKDLDKPGRRHPNTRGGSRGNINHPVPPTPPARAGNGAADGLTQAMDALSLVPSSIRFGRGASRARGAPGQVHGPRPHARRQDGEHGMDVDNTADLSTAAGQGRRSHRGGGRGHSRNVSAANTIGAAVNSKPFVPENAGAEAGNDVNIGGQDNRGRGRGRGRPPMPPRGLGRGGRARLGLGVGFGARMR